MKTFHLNRLKDESRILGTRAVAEGVQFSNGKCALCWLPVPVSSIVVYDSIEDLVAIHVVEWLDEQVLVLRNALRTIRNSMYIISALDKAELELLPHSIAHYAGEVVQEIDKVLAGDGDE